MLATWEIGRGTFRTFRQKCQRYCVNHKSTLKWFVEMFEMEIVEKKGTSCRRPVKERACEPAVLKSVRASRVSRHLRMDGMTMCMSNSQLYPSQTKILEGLTKEKIQIFEALFKGVITRSGLRTIEKYIENLDFIFCSIFQKSSFGEHKLTKYEKHLGRS